MFFQTKRQTWILMNQMRFHFLRIFRGLHGGFWDLFWSHSKILPKQNHYLQPLLLTQAKRILDNDKEKLLALVTWGVAPGALSMLLCSKVAFEERLMEHGLRPFGTNVWILVNGANQTSCHDFLLEYFKNLKGPNPSFPTFLLIFLPGGFVAVGQSPCIYGKGHHGNDREISVFLLGWWEPGSYGEFWRVTRECLGQKNLWKVPWMAMIQHGFVSLNHSQLCGQLSGTHGPRNQWDVADCLYWKCLDPTKTTEFQVLGGLRIIRFGWAEKH